MSDMNKQKLTPARPAFGMRGPGGHMGGPVQKAKNFKGTLRRLLAYLKPHRVRLAVVFVLAIASTVFTIASPKIMGEVMNKVKDSFVARMLVGQMSDTQSKAREAIASQMKAMQAAAMQAAALAAAQGTAAPGAVQVPPSQPSPALVSALREFMALPELKNLTGGKEKAAALRSMFAIFAKLPPEAMAAFGSTKTDATANTESGMAGMKFTQAQMEDALVAVESTNGELDYTGMGKILLFLLGMYLFSALFTFASGWLMSTVSQRTVYDLRRAVDRKLGKLPLRYFDGHPHGEILSRVTNDVDTISTTLQQSITQGITSIVQLVGFVIMMLSISGTLTLIVLGTLPLYIIATMFTAKKSQKFFAAQQKELGAISGHIEEMYSGHVIVKAFGREKRALEEFDSINGRLAKAGSKAQFISGIMFPAMNFVSNLGYVLISVVGGLWMTKARLNLGDITAFIQYSRSFTQPIMQTANIANVIQSTVACAERVFEMLDETEELPDDADAVLPAKINGEINITAMDFSYKAEEPLIRNLSLDVKKGHTIAIVGPTGAGKTTLVNLLMRFYEIQDGTISVDGVDIRKMPRAGLRSIFGMVLQDTWLFNGTIRENIAYGRDGAAESDIIQAAKAAHADHFIRTLPDGYDTILNEEATNISQGQKQLLTIARAILANPAVLILDEATSSVDTRTEVLIQKAMTALMADRTAFVIAHRLSTIRDAELILVMDRGSIIEQGRHDELLSKGGFYADLYKAQFTGHQAESA